MELQYIFLIIWLIVAILICTKFVIDGRKALKPFPKLGNSKFIYKEDGASGYSTKSIITKYGGANKALRIRVTDEELWITTNTFMASIADRFDLLHIIPLRSLKSVTRDHKKIEIQFDHNRICKTIILLSKDPEKLFQLLNAKMSF
ncbi:hypothetical protein JCM19298_2244 [Nonlabens ulvanivorans]|nr:hypothetical protein JCM19298_2244 [Nonlabens ulvanivorans]